MVTKKASPRTMPIITRESYSVEKSPVTPHWIDDFSNSLQKISVEPMRNSQQSIYDQISSIMGKKSKYPTVEAAVEDMKERSGLTAYLMKVQSNDEDVPNKKRAQQNQIMIFKNHPQIKSTVDNYLEDTKGNLPIPAIVEKIKSIHKYDVADETDWDDPLFLKYINDKNIEINKKYPNHDNEHQNLGKMPIFNDSEIDPSNTDALHALNPAVASAAEDEARILSYLHKK